ncbi:MAG: secondary thiamine-phosphate synthase enzyme YjbQ [Candidatus Acidiferrales bacterium]|jgi:secondary thiamine-phosphate synthase enzyme
MPDSRTNAIARKHIIEVRSSRRTELINVTARVHDLVTDSGVANGICHLYVPHTTAGVLINEGYDPDVASDMEAAFDRIVPTSLKFKHAEGNSDSHIKLALTGTSQSIFIERGRLALGRWQMVFFAEFDGPRHRELHVKIVPDPS